MGWQHIVNWEPKGRAALMLRAMRSHANHDKAWTPQEAAEIMDCDTKCVHPCMAACVTRGLVVPVRQGRLLCYALAESDAKASEWNPAADIRVPRYDPSYRFPKMVAPRSAA